MKEISKEKCRCKESFYWNLTQPYFQFEEGVKIYSFDFCDWIGTEENFTNCFDTIDQIREEKLNKILGN
jgi:hypothetical protein